MEAPWQTGVATRKEDTRAKPVRRARLGPRVLQLGDKERHLLPPTRVERVRAQHHDGRDHKNKRLMELVEGKSGVELRAGLAHIPGRENVRWVSLDMSDSYEASLGAFSQTLSSSPTSSTCCG